MANSLLLTLLTKEPAKLPKEPAKPPRKPGPPIKSSRNLKVSRRAEENIAQIVEAIEGPNPDVLKDVAQQELYEILYSIIEKEYDESKKNPAEDADNPTLNKAIGMALEMAINEFAEKGAPKDHPIIMLREVLRKKIVKVLTPKEL